MTVRKLSSGGFEFHSRLSAPGGEHRCELVQRLLPTRNSVRWEIEILGEGKPWTTPIETVIRWPHPDSARWWTGWADPRGREAAGWSDPLVPQPFRDMRLWYGALPYRSDNPMYGYVPFRYDTFCLPMATVIYPGKSGFTVALSPEDTLLEMSLATDARGGMAFSRMNHRIQAGKPVRFSLYICAHEDDWRSGLSWMTRRYPKYFDPPNPKADDMAGCGAYSTFQGDLDLPKMRQMAFRTNWQASFEFPYMGMFLPPVADDAEWTNFRGVKTSFLKLNDYYRRMRSDGFFVLSYFNATEFGAYLKPPKQVGEKGSGGPGDHEKPGDAGSHGHGVAANHGIDGAPYHPVADPLWRDASAFLYTRLNDAWLRGADGRLIGSWEGSCAMDPGDPAYRSFLLQQAGRHLEKTPGTCGICIDRTDWLRLYNGRADDGVSWFEGAPARSLLVSWKGLMSELGPMMHRADKSIFLNLHLKRLEMLRQADGIFDEFGYNPASMNQDGFLGIRKPTIGWTADEGNLKPDPDAFFQRLLYMGVYPMCPYPGNDHSILPSPWAEKQYQDYGPLLDAMRGKKWVLVPHVVSVQGGAALANLFRVPGGYALPVVSGKADSVHVVLRNLPAADLAGVTARALHPGVDSPVPVPIRRSGRDLVLDVPLRRGCAMVVLRSRA